MSKEKAEKTCDCGECGGEEVSQCGCTSTEKSNEGQLKIVKAPDIYRGRRKVTGETVTVIDVIFDSSTIDLSDNWSRAVPRGDIHEIMLWNPDAEEDNAAAIAFIEVTQGGNIVNGDAVNIDGLKIGELAGFDYNHMPNHMNLVVKVNDLKVPIKLGSVVEFIPGIGTPDLDCC